MHLSFDRNPQWKILFQREKKQTTQHTSVLCILTQPTERLEESLPTHQRSLDSTLRTIDLKNDILISEPFFWSGIIYYWPQKAATDDYRNSALYSERWAQCGKKKSLSLSQRVFRYSALSMLSMISMSSISSSSLFLPLLFPFSPLLPLPHFLLLCLFLL